MNCLNHDMAETVWEWDNESTCSDDSFHSVPERFDHENSASNQVLDSKLIDEPTQSNNDPSLLSSSITAENNSEADITDVSSSKSATSLSSSTSSIKQLSLTNEKLTDASNIASLARKEVVTKSDDWEWGDDWSSGDQLAVPEQEATRIDQQTSSIDIERPDSSAKTNSSLWEWSSFKDMVSAVSNVLESGLGVPTPEEFARLTLEEKHDLAAKVDQLKETWPTSDHDDCDSATDDALSSEGEQIDCGQNSPSGFSSISGNAFGLFSGVGKTLVTGSLDVLERVGKKTFETLTVTQADATGRTKRRMRFQQQDDGQTLSQVLRELKTTQSEDETAVERPIINFADIFEKCSGMVHLEGLETLSDHCRTMVASKSRRIDAATRARLAAIAALYDRLDERESPSDCRCLRDELAGSLARIDLAFEPTKLFAVDRQINASIIGVGLSSASDLHRLAIESLANFTALSIESLHKMGQLQLIANAAPNVDAYFEFTLILCAEVSSIANKYSEAINNSMVDEDTEMSSLLTSLFLEANNCNDYIKQALVLLHTVFQRAIIAIAERPDYGID